MFAPEHVLEVLQELEEKVGTHATHSAADVVVLTDFAIKHGASKAERIWADLHKDDVNFKRVPAATFQKYKGLYDANKKAGISPLQCYFVPKKLGRAGALTVHEDNSLVLAIALTRKKKRGVNAQSVSCMARGIVKRLRPELIERGVLDLSPSWASKWMVRKGMCVRATQTNRHKTSATRKWLNNGRREEQKKSNEAVD